MWVDRDENFYAQCANVGDSFCVMRCASLFIELNNTQESGLMLNYVLVKGGLDEN